MNVADVLADRLITRGIYLERYKSGFSRKILATIEDLENELTKELAGMFSAKIPNPAVRVKRLENLLASTRQIIRRAYAENQTLSGIELLQLAKNEQTYVVDAINEPIGIDLARPGIVLPPQVVGGVTVRQAVAGIFDRELNYDELKKLVDGTLIHGAQSAEWWSRQTADMTQRFSDQMRQGVMRGDTLDQLVARVRGTQAKLYTDGIMQATRRNAEALVRTSVQAVANSTRLATYNANSDLISAIQWVSTLDSHTTQICIALSGLTWNADTYRPIGHSIPFPGATAHWGCRSTQIVILKKWNDLAASLDPGQLDAEYQRQLSKQGFSDSQIATMKRDTRSSLDGQVAADISFDDWLSGKSAAFQDSMLGAGKGKLFRDGKITLTDLLDQSGRPLTLADLEKLSGPGG